MKFLKIIFFSLILNFVNSKIFSMRNLPITRERDIADEGKFLLNNLGNLVTALMDSCQNNDIDIDNLNNNIAELFNIYKNIKQLFKNGTLREKIYLNGACIRIIERMRGHRVVEFIDNYINQNNLNNDPYALSILQGIL